jgi:hypothetical protein
VPNNGMDSLEKGLLELCSRVLPEEDEGENAIRYSKKRALGEIDEEGDLMGLDIIASIPQRTTCFMGWGS